MSALPAAEPRPIAMAPLPAEPLVSVIMSNYNYARFLPAAVASVLAQTYARFELIICDDGSADDSWAVIGALTVTDARIRAIRQPNGGQASAWNAALALATGEVLCFLDPDDLFEPAKLATVVAAFRAAPRAGLCCHPLLPIDASGRPLDRPFPRQIERGWFVERALARGGWSDASPTSGLAARRTIVEQLLPIPACLRLGYCDQYIEACGQFVTELAVIEEPLTRYRVHGANASATRAPTPATVMYQLDHHDMVFASVRDFVACRYGDGMAGRLRLDDVPGYREQVLALHALTGGSGGVTRGHAVRDILDRMPATRRRQIWTVITRLPRPLARRAFKLWWGQPEWKRRLRPALRLLRMPPA